MPMQSNPGTVSMDINDSPYAIESIEFSKNSGATPQYFIIVSGTDGSTFNIQQISETAKNYRIFDNSYLMYENSVDLRYQTISGQLQTTKIERDANGKLKISGRFECIAVNVAVRDTVYISNGFINAFGEK
jgi:ABC-type xylose transport system substrate-binding protein